MYCCTWEKPLPFPFSFLIACQLIAPCLDCFKDEVHGLCGKWTNILFRPYSMFVWRHNLSEAGQRSMHAGSTTAMCNCSSLRCSVMQCAWSAAVLAPVSNTSETNVCFVQSKLAVAHRVVNRCVRSETGCHLAAFSVCQVDEHR